MCVFIILKIKIINFCEKQIFLYGTLKECLGYLVACPFEICYNIYMVPFKFVYTNT